MTAVWDDEADYVVVGSGAAGATAALDLARAGADVLVLEEGGWLRREDFRPDLFSGLARLWRDFGGQVATGRSAFPIAQGCCVGGSTVINGGMSWRTPERILERWRREAGVEKIEMPDLEATFERVERRIHVRHQDPESIGHDNALLKRGADAKGWRVIPNLRNQVHCPGSNNCAFGCPTGAKQSALVSYIPRALHFGARLLSDVRVERITMHGKRATGIVGRVVGADGEPSHRVSVRAKLVAKGGKLGLYARGGHELVDIPECIVLRPELREIARALRPLLPPAINAVDLRQAEDGNLARLERSQPRR